MKTRREFLEMLDGCCQLQLGFPMPEKAQQDYADHLGERYSWDECCAGLEKLMLDSLHGYAMPSTMLISKQIEMSRWCEAITLFRQQMIDVMQHVPK